MHPANEGDRNGLLTALLGLLAEVCQRGEPLHIGLHAGGVVLTLDVRLAAVPSPPQQPVGRPPATPPANATAEANLSRLQRKLLEAAGSTPVPTKQLIRLAGYQPSSYTRGAITELVRQGLLIRTADGIYRPT